MRCEGPLDTLELSHRRSRQGVETIRDAMLDMWEAELGQDFTPKAPMLGSTGWLIDRCYSPLLLSTINIYSPVLTI